MEFFFYGEDRGVVGTAVCDELFDDPSQLAVMARVRVHVLLANGNRIFQASVVQNVQRDLPRRRLARVAQAVALKSIDRLSGSTAERRGVEANGRLCPGKG